MMKTTLRHSMAFLLLALVAQYACAMGLGKAKVLSRIGEPLLIEVEVLAPSAAALEAASARIAPESAYRVLGAEYNPMLTGANARIETRDGRALVRVRTPASFEDVWLALVLELDTAEGRVRRHYDLLLDPKGSAAAPDAPPAAVDADAPARPARAAAPPQPSAARTPDATAVAAHATQADAAVYTVQAGDTLSEIARRFGHSRRTRAAAMARIVSENAAAFAAGDPHRLQAGMVLRIPLAADRTPAQAPADAVRLAGIPDRSKQPKKRSADLPVAPNRRQTPAADGRAEALAAASEALRERVEGLKTRIEQLDAQILAREQQERAHAESVAREARARNADAPEASQSGLRLAPITAAQAAQQDRRRYSPVGHSNETLAAMLLLGILGGFAAGYRLVRLSLLDYVPHWGRRRADAAQAQESMPSAETNPAAPAPRTPTPPGSRTERHGADLDFSQTAHFIGRRGSAV